MNIKQTVQALEMISEGFATLALAFEDPVTQPATQKGTGAGVASGAVSPPGAAPDDLPPLPPLMEEAYADELEEQQPQGALAVCPKHRKPYREGKYGPYCAQKTNDPAWADKNGFCRISPKNAAQWLRTQAAVPA